jgi:hypothetical protein
MQARQSTGDFVAAEAQVGRNALVGYVALDQSKQLELATGETVAEFGVREVMHPGWPCHSLSLSHFRVLRQVALPRSVAVTSRAVLTQPKNVATLWTVARWISGEPAGMVASSISTGQYSWK